MDLCSFRFYAINIIVVMQKKKLVISFSGGLTSAYMTYNLLNDLDYDEWEIIVVYGNTGKEREETLEFIRDCDTYFNFNTVWVEAVINPLKGAGTRHKVVDFNTASRNGEPFEAMLYKYGIPNISCKHCTRELKINPIRSYAKNEMGWSKFYTAIGIRSDEAHRMSKDAAKYWYIYPLVTDYQACRKDVNRFWMQQDFTLNLKSYEGNCDLCLEKSDRKIITIANERPQSVDWWRDMGNKFMYYVPEGRKNAKPPFFFYRKNRTIDDIINITGKEYIPAEDESMVV